MLLSSQSASLLYTIIGRRVCISRLYVAIMLRSSLGFAFSSGLTLLVESSELVDM